MDLTYDLFCGKFRSLTGIDLASYKQGQMERRILAYISRTGLGGYATLLKSMERDQTKMKEFLDYMTINVSEFFRNPEKFDELRTRVFPAILANTRQPRIWSAGCAGGAEPYSMAIILDEMAPDARPEIIATDIDATILEKARTGWFPANETRNISQARLSRYFAAQAGGLVVSPQIRSRVAFEKHNLLEDRYPEDCDLIVCRNVVIYFADGPKDRVYRQFWESLKAGGILFIGGTETIFGSAEMGFNLLCPFMYQKTGVRAARIA